MVAGAGEQFLISSQPLTVGFTEMSQTDAGLICPDPSSSSAHALHIATLFHLRFILLASRDISTHDLFWPCAALEISAYSLLPVARSKL